MVYLYKRILYVNVIISNETFVCFLHFDANNYSTTKSRPRLKSNAVSCFTSQVNCNDIEVDSNVPDITILHLMTPLILMLFQLTLINITLKLNISVQVKVHVIAQVHLRPLQISTLL